MFWRKKGLLGGAKKWGVLLLGLWLIATGVLHFTGKFPRSEDVLAVVALLAGILIVLDR